MFGDHWFFKIKLKPFIMAFKAVYILASNDFVASSTSLYHTQCSNIVGATTHSNSTRTSSFSSKYFARRCSIKSVKPLCSIIVIPSALKLSSLTLLKGTILFFAPAALTIPSSLAAASIFTPQILTEPLLYPCMSLY